MVKRVAFGVLSQLVLENVSTEDLEEVVEFCINIGLPVTFEELGIKKLDEEKLMEAATLACAEGIQLTICLLKLLLKVYTMLCLQPTELVTTTKITNKINYFNNKGLCNFAKSFFVSILNTKY